VKLGDQVGAGQLLATIDPSNQENRIRNQETQLNQQKFFLANQAANVGLQESNLARQESLKARGIGASEKYDQAAAQLRQARAQLAQAEAQVKMREVELESAVNDLSRTKIKAPIDGIVAEVVARQGTTVNANQNTPTIIRLAKMDVMTVRAQVSEADIMKVKPGQKVYFTVLGEPQRKYYATLRARELTPANGVLDPGAGGNPKGAIYYNALFEVANTDGSLLPAMTAEVHVVLKEARNVPTIPSTALGDRDADGRYSVRVVKPDGEVEQRKVTVGLNNNFLAEVKSGLKVGDQVVVGEAGPPQSAQAAGRGPLFGNAQVPLP
jgi:macrolide-specific efflux system membrane fusion protein